MLHAKQYIVFFAIGLYTLDFAVALGSAWLYRHEPLAELLYNRGPLADAVAARRAVIAAVFIVYLLVGTWLRAGYIRSLVGPFCLRPAGRRQFLRLLAFALALEIVGALAAGAFEVAGDHPLPVNAVFLGLLALNLVVLYADYIIVIADVGPLRAVALSWRTVRAAPIPSALVLLSVTILGYYAARFLHQNVTGGLARSMPLMIVQCTIMGGVMFVADVVLVVLYLDAAETGRLTPKPRSAGDGRML
ncbi:MAG: hypothetical protein NTW58_01650 [Actinobacteria bacterium]|nr:hypothetical protein [Actinomycetota bacterium]